MKIIKINNLTIYFLIILLFSGYLLQGIIIFTIVIIHEFGHILIIKFFKYNIKSITIFPFGGITVIDKKINTSTNKELLIAWGGILIQLLLHLLVRILPFRIYFKSIFYRYNIAIIIFNLFPIIPLDGSIIVNAILNKFFSFKNSYILSGVISIISIIGYLVINYYYSLNNYLIVGLFLYKTFQYITNYRYIHNRFLLERYINKLDFKYISTKSGNVDILKLDTYQYFKDRENIVSEREKLRELFDNKP